MMDIVIQKAIEFGAFLSAFAGIGAAAMMLSVTGKFGTGIVASGFRFIAIGVAFIGFAMTVDAVTLIFQLQTEWVALAKVSLLAIGAYTIVVGTKQTADRLEKLR